MSKTKAIIKNKPETTNPVPVDNTVEKVDSMKRTILKGIVISVAKNPQWIYVRLIPENERVLAVIPKRFSQKVIGKLVSLESITDETGTSYRYIINE